MLRMRRVPQKTDAVYLFDGTTQSRDKSEYKDWSNIVRLHALVFSHPPSDGVLLDMYGDGVGCRVNEKIFGSTMGKGLEKRIEEAYYDLGTQVGNARKGGDDLHVFVFGFSRGAYEARLFCELVACCGVPSNEGSYDEAMSRLVAHDLDAARKGVVDGKYLSPPYIDLLGVFDTVKMTKYGSGVDISKLPNIVRHACHAMSYNERRSIFPLTRFAPGQQNVEEVWFIGSHTDVGGGYVTRGLADCSLEWMVGKANEYGLPVALNTIEGDTANHEAKFNDSATWCQTLWGLLTKERVAQIDDVFHWSVEDQRSLVANAVPDLPDTSVIAYTPRPNVMTMMA